MKATGTRCLYDWTENEVKSTDCPEYCESYEIKGSTLGVDVGA